MASPFSVGKGLTPERRDELIVVVLERLGLYEPSEHDRWLAAGNLRDIPGFEPPSYMALRKWLSVFERKRSIDHVLLLSLLYMRALARTNLDEAILLRDSLSFLINRFCRRPGFSGDTETLWQFITWRRVMTGRLDLSHTKGALARAELLLVPVWMKKATTEPGKEQYRWCRWIGACSLEMQDQPFITKIANRTPALTTFLSDRPRLAKRAAQATKAEILERIKKGLEEPVSAYQRFNEMHGYHEPWRPGDY